MKSAIKQDFYSHSYLYGQDSIEMANESVDEQDEQVVEQDIYNQSNLTQRILDAEKRFSTSSIHSSYFSSEYFESPALYRVLFMGSATGEERKDIFKKLSQGFVQVLHYRQHLLKTRQKSNASDSGSSEDISLLDQPLVPFKEIKHNILLLSDEDEQDLISDVYEDIGVSIIEADFTWSSTAINYAQDPENLLLQYAWKQCPNPQQLPTAWLAPELEKTEFKGYMYSDHTPNGIDLCVYFYKDDQNDKRVEQDLVLLCTLRKFGIYVLPLTTTRDESTKAHFADMLTRHKVRCLDLGNLDVGQQPSFFYRPTPMLDRISRLQDMECTQANLPKVATWQILAIDQFCVIKNHAIFQLLKRTRERQAIREEIKEEYFSQKKQWVEKEPSDNSESDSQVYSYDHHVTLNTPTQELVSQQKKKEYYVDYRQLFRAIIVVCIASLICMNYCRQQPWTAEFKMNTHYQFTLETKDGQGNLGWGEGFEPQVWLNHNVYIPIEKIENQPGLYQLKFNILELNEISFELSVNTTDRSKYTFYTKPLHYVLINPTNRQQEQLLLLQQDLQQRNSDENQQESFKKAWDTVVFFTRYNILKFLLVD